MRGYLQGAAALGLAVAMVMAFWVDDAQATSITVTTTTDVTADDGVCSLREAITAAETNTASGASSGECPAGGAIDTVDAGSGTHLISSDLPLIDSILIITGTGTIDAGGTSGIFSTGSSAVLVVDGLTLTGGEHPKGGAFYLLGGDVTVTNSTITGNNHTMFPGAGGVFVGGADVTISNSVVEFNTSDEDTGGILLLGGSLAVQDSVLTENGGGAEETDALAVRGGAASLLRSTVNEHSNQAITVHTGASLTVDSSSIVDNSDTAIFSDGTLTVTNSTLSGNSGLNGAAIDNRGDATIVFSTITNNSATISGKGILSAPVATTRVSASIVADNTGSGEDIDLLGSTDTFVSGSYNIIGSTDANVSAFGAGTDDLTGVSGLGLAALALNAGGTTETHAITAPSNLAYNHVTGTITFGADQSEDQNGTARPGGSAKDAGAYEAPDFCGSPQTVTDQASWHFVIDCYNSLSTGTLVANVTADVTYTGAVLAIFNTAAGTLQVNGNGNTFDADGLGTVLEMSDGDVAIADLTLTGGVHARGGGVYKIGGDLTLHDSAVDSNVGNDFPSAGGIFNGGGSVTLNGTSVSANDGPDVGGITVLGGTATVQNDSVIANSTGSGGLGLRVSASATAVVTESTASGNAQTAIDVLSGGSLIVDSSTISDNSGAGITNNGTMTMTNSTVSGNVAGISNSTTATVVFSTITNNVSFGLRSGLSGSTNVSASIVVENGGLGDIALFGSTNTFASGSYNIVGSIDSNVTAFGPATNDLIGQSNLGLGLLGANGGPTETHAIGNGSMAVDRVIGPITIGVVPTTDQRGTARPQGADLDAGAYEGVSVTGALCDGELVWINLATNGGDGTGTSGDDVMLGTTTDDNMNGSAGADTICGGAGDDFIRGGAGDDTIFGDDGDDRVRGGGGSDLIDGGVGADELAGQGGTDTINGGAGPDKIDGQGAPDVLNGGSGVDTINGQNGGDTINGDNQGDILKGQTGPDTFKGGSGDDDMTGGDGADTLFGGPGIDKCAGNTGPDSAEAATCETTPGVETLF